MNELISKKLKIVRDFLNLSQPKMEKATGVPRPTISHMENNDFNHVPTRYLTYMASQGINMSALLDLSVSEDAFKDLLYGRAQLLLPGGPVTPCPDCAGKDEMLHAKDEIIAGKSELIGMLRDKIILLSQQEQAS
jgi:transcriptional regulator with XRE-family HTH domain